MKKSPQPRTDRSAQGVTRSEPRSERSPGMTSEVVPGLVVPHRVQPPGSATETASWTFLTNHTHVLLCLYRDPDQRLREVAQAVGITERMVQRIVAELVEGGYLTISKEGRCNRYTVLATLQLRHPLEMQHTIGELLTLLSPVAQ